jgi:hypothetical protein
VLFVTTLQEQLVKNPDSMKYLVGALDAAVLVYDITDSESYARVQSIKSTIDRLGLLREKKDSVVLILGNKLDLVTGSTQQSGGDSANSSGTSQQLAVDDTPMNISPSVVYSRAVDSSTVQKWIAKEKEFPKDRTRFAEVTVRDRSPLIDSFCWMINKLTQVPPGKFPKFPKAKTSDDVHK